MPKVIYITHRFNVESNYYAWGGHGSGQIGDGSIDASSGADFLVPTALNLSNVWAKIIGRQFSTLAIKTDGTLWAWGKNDLGQLGLGDLIDRSVPTQVGSDTWLDIDCYRHSLAIKSDGTLWGWGDNAAGALGNNSTTSTSSPIQIGAANDWMDIACGTASGAYSVGIRGSGSGTLWTWGSGSDGSLGHNNTTNLSSPVQVGARTDWVKCEPATFLRGDSTVWCSGPATLLGRNTGTSVSSPVQALVGSAVVDISAGLNSTIALKGNGELWAWGFNSAGTLGDGTNVTKSSPVMVIGAQIWTQVSTSLAGSVVAIDNGGTLWAWGIGTGARIGDGTRVSKSSPVQISTLTDWIYAYASQGPSYAIRDLP